ASRAHPGDPHDAADAAQVLHHGVQLLEAADHQLERVLAFVVAGRMHLRAGDVDAGRADRLRHGGEQTRRVDARDLDVDRARHALRVLPLDVDAALRVRLLHFRAVAGVDGDAAAARDEARDALAGQRLAALREAHEDLAVEAGHPHGALRRPRDEAHEAGERAFALLAAALELELRDDLREHLLARELPVADLG